mgnify:CR=1 FL=1
MNGRCQHIFCAFQTIFRHYLFNSASAQPHTIKALCKRCVNLVPTPFIQVARRMVLLQFAVFAGISDGLSIYFGWVLLLLLFQQVICTVFHALSHNAHIIGFQLGKILISAGAKIRTIATTIEEGFSLPKVEKFEELINERTRAIMICNPNNPTGYLYTRREMNQIRDLVKKYDLYLFSDEVYREYIYTGSPYISACHLEGIEQNVILIDSVSKRYSECGIRVGALITKNKEVRAAVMKFCQARLSPPLIGQIVAEASLDAPEEYYRDVYDEYVERRKCLIDGLNRIPGVYSPIPMGAFYTVAQLPVDDSETFCRWCLEEFQYEGETVMMAPATGFYTTPGAGINQVRIAYVLKKEDLERALVVLRKALEAYPGRKEQQS